MRAKIKRILGVVLDTLGLYIFSLMGIFMVQYLPAYLSGGSILLNMEWGRFLISCGLAFMVLFMAESEGDQEAKKLRFKKRASHAMLYGISIHALIARVTGGAA